MKRKGKDNTPCWSLSPQGVTGSQQTLMSLEPAPLLMISSFAWISSAANRTKIANRQDSTKAPRLFPARHS